ncbi:hypothetical protein QQ045_024368 [Rhodiola kirilowii]
MLSGELPGSATQSTTIMYKTQSEDHQESRMMYDQLNHDDDQYNKYRSYSMMSSSGCESSSPSSYSAVQKPSSQSRPLLPMNNNNIAAVNYPPAVSSHHRLMDLIDSCRRVFSTGDLQLQMQHQRIISSSSIIEGMLSKACRYNPEEKKERIERYKSKRAHRNFNKKIKYACRKTLADSRPRIRGRFATNNNNINYELDYDQEKHYYYNCGQVVLDYNNNYNNEDQSERHQPDDNWVVDLFNTTDYWSTFN